MMLLAKLYDRKKIYQEMKSCDLVARRRHSDDVPWLYWGHVCLRTILDHQGSRSRYHRRGKSGHFSKFWSSRLGVWAGNTDISCLGKTTTKVNKELQTELQGSTVFAKEGVSLSDSCSFLSLVWSLTVICHSLLTFILLGMILLGFPPSSNTKCFTSKLTVSGYIFPAVSIFSLKSVWRCLARVNPLQIDQIHYKVLHPLSRKCNKSDNNNLPDTDHQYFMTMKSLSKQLQSINRFSFRSHSHWLPHYLNSRWYSMMCNALNVF